LAVEKCRVVQVNSEVFKFSDTLFHGSTASVDFILLILEDLRSHPDTPHLLGLFLFFNITNKIQRYTIFFITVNALHVSIGFSAHHQELKNCTQHRVYAMLACCYR